MNGARPNPLQAHAVVTVGATAQTLSQMGYTLHPNTDVLQIHVEGADVRVTVNGTNPTGSLGVPWSSGTLWELSAVEAGVAKFIREGALNATLQIAAFTA